MRRIFILIILLLFIPLSTIRADDSLPYKIHFLDVRTFPAFSYNFQLERHDSFVVTCIGGSYDSIANISIVNQESKSITVRCDSDQRNFTKPTTPINYNGFNWLDIVDGEQVNLTPCFQMCLHYDANGPNRSAITQYQCEGIIKK